MGGSSRITWPYGHGEGRVDFIIGNILGGFGGEVELFGGGGGGGGASPVLPPLDETLRLSWCPGIYCIFSVLKIFVFVDCLTKQFVLGTYQSQINLRGN